MAKIQQQIKYEIPPEGSLGLLALGAAGIRAWREKKKQVEKPTPKT